MAPPFVEPEPLTKHFEKLFLYAFTCEGAPDLKCITAPNCVIPKNKLIAYSSNISSVISMSLHTI